MSIMKLFIYSPLHHDSGDLCSIELVRVAIKQVLLLLLVLGGDRPLKAFEVWV